MDNAKKTLLIGTALVAAAFLLPAPASADYCWSKHGECVVPCPFDVFRHVHTAYHPGYHCRSGYVDVGFEPSLLLGDLGYGPKNYCEGYAGDWNGHEYGPSTGFVIFLGQDGNLQGECDGDPNTVADFDGHVEFAFGGGWLQAVANAA